MNRITSFSSLVLSGLIVIAALAVTTAEAQTTFPVTNGSDSGAGSLRQAMLDANATAGVDTITFNIGGGGAQEIALTVPLPRISEAVIIDGTTQPGYAGLPVINITGGNSRITIDSGGTTIRGLCVATIAIFTNGNNVLQGNFMGTDMTGMQPRSDGLGANITLFNSSGNLIGGISLAARNLIAGGGGIRLSGASANNSIQGNYIGLDRIGMNALPNLTEGICLCSSGSHNNLIGGTEPGAGNVIAGSFRDEIMVSSAADGNRIQGNLIGLNVAGTAIPFNPEDHGGHGIYLDGAFNTTIGGSTPAARNVIAGMINGSYRGGYGIGLQRGIGNVIKGNYIGTDITGTRPLPNYFGMVLFEAVRNTTIGGTAEGEGNIIAFNQRDGIAISTSLITTVPTTGNVMRGNSIHSNGELGIDLGSGTLIEVNQNDACDADGGVNTPNELQNYPILEAVTFNGANLQISGNLNSVANSTFAIDFYRNTSIDPSGNGEGKIYLGSTSVTTNGTCDSTFQVSLPAIGAGRFITATATDANGNTSEFSKRAILPGTSAFDFDGDGKTDIGIFRPNPGAAEWWINRSGNGQTFALQFGSSTDRIAPADYTGDAKTDIAFFRPASGEWYVLRSEDFSFFALPFGANGDVPVPADYDADGKADFAVYRPSSSTWFISQSSGAPTRIEGFGIVGDVPVVADYDGDAKADVGIFRNNAGVAEWWINRSTAGVLAMQFGAGTDKAVQGDYTGDGKADIAIWRPADGNWLIVRSEDFSFFGFPFGANGDVPSPGDYDGDGKFDPTVFRPSSATWFSGRTTAGTLIVQFGATGDRPIPNAFVP